MCDGLCDECKGQEGGDSNVGFDGLTQDMSPMCDCVYVDGVNANDEAQVGVMDSNPDVANANVPGARRNLRMATSDYESSESPCSIDTCDEVNNIKI